MAPGRKLPSHNPTASSGKGGTLSTNGAAPDGGRPGDGGFPDTFLFGVATAGFPVEGGFNGPGQPDNNWGSWELVGRVEPSGNAVGFWERPDEALDRAAALGCNSFRLGIEWARVLPEPSGPDRAALARYVAIVDGCLARGLEPVVTLHHFTHPAWLGVDFWLRPDAPRWFRQWAGIVADQLSGSVRHWVTVNEIDTLAARSWLTGRFPPGRSLAFGDAAMAVDNLTAAHVAGYEVLHRSRPDAVVTTTSSTIGLYEHDQMVTDLLLAPGAGVSREDLDTWIADRRSDHDAARAPVGGVERMLRRLSAARAPYGRAGARGPGIRERRPRLPHKAVDAVYASPYPRTLDVLGVDCRGPGPVGHARRSRHRTGDGGSWMPDRSPWGESPDPAGLARWLRAQHDLAPSLPLWVAGNGMCNRVRNGRSGLRLDGWDRRRYLREHLGAVAEAVDGGVPVAGYWHWSLVDGYEWGTYEPRYGLYGVDRHRGEHGALWMERDALGHDAAGTYRGIIAGLRSGDRSVLRP